MTVIWEAKYICEYPNSSASDTDVLEIHTPSSSDADANFSNSAAPKVQRKNLSDESLCRKGYMGKRRRRFYTNGLTLQTLAENDESNATCVQLMEDYQNPFERLMENQTALQFWNEFNELPEEEQNLLLNPNRGSSIPSNCHKENAFMQISSKVKRAMKIKKSVPFDVLSDIEKEVLDHFEKNPSELYTTSPKNSFERLMLHAIAQYHNLQSIGLHGFWPPRIQLSTDDNKWKRTDQLFCDLIKKLRR